jgi:adenosyl cobinamide kinase/adenosyl cobinamide phosphate guanylyltransferase
VDNYEENIENTISLHRKKQSNTLYTINALNEVIRSKNNGVLDKRYNVDWSEYQNTLLLTNEHGLNVVPTKIFQIVDIKDWNK